MAALPIYPVVIYRSIAYIYSRCFIHLLIENFSLFFQSALSLIVLKLCDKAVSLSPRHEASLYLNLPGFLTRHFFWGIFKILS
ncbi:MAG: hypothetical protein COA93_02845 [Alphaproteobacteria bacterium]|nr:MAG: hypothetical protein COA93_02845 [Alphaproteobacteria bacterium]